ncbi:PREDICTED: probable aspartyl protease At4g16563 [Camelina sativa]|uniref:Probable aspartyl protease At4g16563 n=1 Tax=Camelina sativa TaxID=90675 RepID=A0ABM0X6Y3_CAMSA|nr:PREDICTED: probable aspartyl protease At4g16563 [Camelina sativa]
METRTNVLFLFLLIITILLNSTKKIQARQHKNPSSSSSSFLVLALTKSSASLPTPISQPQERIKKPLESSLDVVVMEPLREVRDGYLITLNIGTPPQAVQVYMDTGSDLTWVPCGNLSFDCIDCYDLKNNNLKSSSIFSPLHSSSSFRASCASSFCVGVHSSDNPFDPCAISGCSVSMLLKSTCVRPCPSFAYTYGEGGLVSGILTRDILKARTKEVPRFSFGCVASTYREPIGIAGFGRGILSLPSQLGFVEKGFSHCFLPFKFVNNPNISSPLILGASALSIDLTDSLQFTPMLNTPMYPNSYYIGLESVTIGTYITPTQVPLTLRQFDSQGSGGMLIDSGTTYTHLPDPFYSQLLTTLQSIITYPRATETESRTGFDLCYKIPCPNDNLTSLENDAKMIFPSITFNFLNNATLLLPQGNCFYAMSVPSDDSVVKCLLFQNMEDGDYGPAGVFGSFQQQNVKVVYDLEKERIGFQAMDCVLEATSHGLNQGS